MTDIYDTIAAIATPFGNSGIGIIRISGSKAIITADKIIRSRSGKSLGLISMKSHTVHYGFVSDNDKILDEVLCTIYSDPRSFTAEDTVEINCHGGIASTNKILEILLENGCRLATPGEFTKRAFLNGRIDISQAQAVNDLLYSKTNNARKIFMNGLTGLLNKKIE